MSEMRIEVTLMDAHLADKHKLRYICFLVSVSPILIILRATTN